MLQSYLIIRRKLNIIGPFNDKNITSYEIFKNHCHSLKFIEYIENKLLPSLQPDQVVIIDNAFYLNPPRAMELIESVGCKLKYLPTLLS